MAAHLTPIFTYPLLTQSIFAVCWCRPRISSTALAFLDALTLQYYHIDLEDHDVVLAEGAPAETYQGDNYWAFGIADEYVALYGAPVGRKKPFAPVVSYRGGARS